ncbi:MAG: hypothetical protein Q8M56_05030, partial [Desulfobacterales bacterium]|nr:hypothetical protein [Desulfobacterales bacterium]
MSIYSLIFQKKFGKIGLKQLIKYLSIIIGVVYLPIAAVACVSNLFTKTDKYAAILLSAHAFSDHDYWAPPIAFLGSYPAWTLYFNSRGEKSDYFFSATKKDFMDVLMDNKYQSIVFVGHGSRNCWRATDTQISNNDIDKMKGKFQLKHGEWIQLSCAEPDYSPVHMGELVMANKNVYYYGGSAGTFDFVLDALTAFR